MPRHQLAPPIRSRRSGDEFVRQKQNSDAAGGTTTPPHTSPNGGEGGGWVSPPEASSKNPIETIKNMAAGLNPGERKRLLAELSLDAQHADRGASRDLDMWSQAVYEALVAANGGGAGGVPGPMVIKRLLSASSSWSAVRGFMSDAKLDTLKVTERQGVYRFLAGLVLKNARYISRRNEIPLTPKLMGTCATNIAAIFEAAFPGYVRCGLAHVVARQVVHSH